MMASCSLLSFDGESSDGGYGLFSLSLPDVGTEECTRVGDIEEITGRYGISRFGDDIVWKPKDDNFLRGAQAGSSFAMACGAALIILVAFRQFLCRIPCTDFLMDLFGLSVQVGLGMVYLLWLSDGCSYFDCGYGDASTFLVVSQVLWMLASCLTKCMGPSAADRKKALAEERKKRALDGDGVGEAPGTRGLPGASEDDSGDDSSSSSDDDDDDADDDAEDEKDDIEGGKEESDNDGKEENDNDGKEENDDDGKEESDNDGKEESDNDGKEESDNDGKEESDKDETEGSKDEKEESGDEKV